MESVTPYADDPPPLVAGVLNAFRHHGIGHKAFTNAAALTPSCSTPSGIMESVTN